MAPHLPREPWGGGESAPQGDPPGRCLSQPRRSSHRPASCSAELVICENGEWHQEGERVILRVFFHPDASCNKKKAHSLPKRSRSHHFLWSWQRRRTMPRCLVPAAGAASALGRGAGSGTALPAGSGRGHAARRGGRREQHRAGPWA